MEKLDLIPKLSHEELLKRAERIKPLFSFNGKLYLIEDVDISRVSFIWEPKKKGIAPKMTVLGEILTYHTYGHPMLFKPSIAEVLSQIPEQYLEEVVAFQIVGQPNDADDLNRYTTITNAGYHMAITQLYGRIKDNESNSRGGSASTHLEENHCVQLPSC